MKIMLIITMVVAISTLVIVLFRKDRVQLEDEEGNTLAGVSSKMNLQTTEA